MLLYTPPFSAGGLGTVTVTQRPYAPASPAAYRTKLARRIQLLLDDADDPREIEALLHQLELQENINLVGQGKNIGEHLAEYSQTLRELAAYPVEPIQPDDWQPDAETEGALGHETAEEYLLAILR